MASIKQQKQESKPGKARILLVDDHAVVRFGIAQLINRQEDMIVCGEEEDASRRADGDLDAQARTWSSRIFPSRTAAAWS